MNWVSVEEGLPDRIFVDEVTGEFQPYQVMFMLAEEPTVAYLTADGSGWWFYGTDGSTLNEHLGSKIVAWCPLADPTDYVRKIQEEAFERYQSENTVQNFEFISSSEIFNDN